MSSSPKLPKLKARQEAFCQEYLKDFNGTQAAIRAGYSDKTARVIATENLLKPAIYARIEGLKREKLDDNIATARQVLEELTLLATTDIADFLDIDTEGGIKVKTFAEMPKGASRAIRKIKEKRVIRQTPGDSPDMILESTFEFELWDKPKSLDLLGQHHSLYQQKKPDAPGDPVGIEKSLQAIADAIQGTDG